MTYGYEMINGNVVINQREAGIVRQIFRNYISGMSFTMSARKAGITLSHSSVKRILLKKCYVGDDFYPAIIDRETFLTYKSGTTDAGEMWLVRKSSQQMSTAETARYIHEKLSGGEAISVPFGWLGSVGNYISVLHDCSGVSADEYYLAWKAVTDNTSPMIRTVKVLEVTT